MYVGVALVSFVFYYVITTVAVGAGIFGYILGQ